MADSGLKSCPFCGNDAMLSYNTGRYGAFGFVQCIMCNCQTKTVKVIEPNRFDDEASFWKQRAFTAVITSWNTRASETEVKA